MSADEPHVIRLRGPWQVVCEPAIEGSASQKVHLPALTATLLPGDFRGRLELKRNFNWPEPLQEREALWLVVESAVPPSCIELNEQSLTLKPSRAAWDITSLFATRNELRIAWQIVAPVTDRFASWLEVRLEVRWMPR